MRVVPLALVVVTILVGACGSSTAPPPPSPTPTPWPSPSLGAGEYWLPSDSRLGAGPGETPQPCAGIGIAEPGANTAGVPLHGSASDPRFVWLGDAPNRVELVWPPGYFVRFTGAEFVIFDRPGVGRHRSGERIDGGCTFGTGVLGIPDW